MKTFPVRFLVIQSFTLLHPHSSISTMKSVRLINMWERVVLVAETYTSYSREKKKMYKIIVWVSSFAGALGLIKGEHFSQPLI